MKVTIQHCYRMYHLCPLQVLWGPQKLQNFHPSHNKNFDEEISCFALQERPSLVFGDTVHIRFACLDIVEFTGFVIATEATSCMLCMPKHFYACSAPSPRSPSEEAHVRLCAPSCSSCSFQVSCISLNVTKRRVRAHLKVAAIHGQVRCEPCKALPIRPVGAARQGLHERQSVIAGSPDGTSMDENDDSSLLQVVRIMNTSQESIRSKDFSLLHVRFGFDRTRMQRMHAALQSCLDVTQFNMLPPDQTPAKGVRRS